MIFNPSFYKTGIFPAGDATFTENGVYDVTEYETATVSVDQTDTIKILTRNGSSFPLTVDASRLTALTTYQFYNPNVGGLYAFTTDLILPTLAAIPAHSVRNMYALTSLTIPSTVETIGASAIRGCVELTSIIIPAAVKTISVTAFEGDTALTTVIFQGDGAGTTIAADAFTGCTALTAIRVPWAEGAVANAPWGADAEDIVYNYTGA